MTVIETETQTQPVFETQDSDSRSDLICSLNPRKLYHHHFQVTGLKCIVFSDSKIFIKIKDGLRGWLRS